MSHNPHKPCPFAARAALFRHVDAELATMNAHADNLRAYQDRKPAHVFQQDEAQRAQYQPTYTDPSPETATDEVPLWMFAIGCLGLVLVMGWVVPALIGGR